MNKADEFRKLEKELIFLRARINKTLDDMRTVRSGSVTCIVNGLASNAMSHWMYFARNKSWKLMKLD